MEQKTLLWRMLERTFNARVLSHRLHLDLVSLSKRSESIYCVVMMSSAIQVAGGCWRGLNLVLLLLELLHPPCYLLHPPASNLQPNLARPKQPVQIWRGGFEGIRRKGQGGNLLREERERGHSDFRRRGGDVESTRNSLKSPIHWQVGLRALNTYSGQVVAVVVEDASLVSSNHLHWLLQCLSLAYSFHLKYQECPKNLSGDSVEHWQFWQHPGGATAGAGGNFFGRKHCGIFLT